MEGPELNQSKDMVVTKKGFESDFNEDASDGILLTHGREHEKMGEDVLSINQVL
jgi:hypothetical protein